MKFALRIKQEGGRPNNYPYVFHMDEKGVPTKMLTFKADNEHQAINLISDISFCKSIGLTEYEFFKPYKLERV